MFFEVCQPFETEDIELAVSQFISGTAENYNPSFAPTAPQFATQVRKIRDYDLYRTSMANQGRAQIAQRDKPQVEKSLESMARVKSMAKELDLSTDKPNDPAERHKALEELHRQDTMFAADYVENGDGLKVSKRLLGLLNIDVGDPEGRDD